MPRGDLEDALTQLKEISDEYSKTQQSHEIMKGEFETLKRNFLFKESEKSGSIELVRELDLAKSEAESNLLILIDKHTALQNEFSDLKVTLFFYEFVSSVIYLFCL